jgi:omega-6 fatty acid desaturase (delta-12 desaturase)
MGKGSEKNILNKTKQEKRTELPVHCEQKQAIDKLSEMSIEKLREYGQKLAISGAVSMSKETLLIELQPFARGILDPSRPDYFPLGKIPVKLSDLKNAIPAHCFERSLIRSFGHLFLDLAMIATLGYLASFIPSSGYLPYVLWPLYWAANGVVMTGVWVLSHECGHQAFSDYTWVNNTVGTIFHSLLLVPYHPWRISHGLHHANAGSMEHDEVFLPTTRSDILNEALSDAPIVHFFHGFLMLFFGWHPGYLFFNIAGPEKYRNKPNSHFNPNSVLFRDSQRSLVVQSDLALLVVLAIIVYVGQTYGWLNVLFYYGVPEVVVNLMLVLITYLQHTDVFLPHMRENEWNWLRGACLTIDREYGWIFDVLMHHITDTHVAHHIFSKMPFYHCQEATKVIKEKLGPYYTKDTTPVPQALWRALKNCQFVEDEGDIVFYKDASGSW